jgi:hypothetical protein
MKQALLILPAIAIALYLLGGWLMSIYGLDPPYIYFHTGMWMQLAAFSVPIVELLLLLVIGIRKR